jgi:hypothetical protein
MSEGLLPLNEDADPDEFTQHEDFYTALVACGMLKARGSRESLTKLPIWWTERTENGSVGELFSDNFRLYVQQKWAAPETIPDLRLESTDSLVLVETKVDAKFDEDSFKSAFAHLLGDSHRTKVYLLMAPAGYGTPPLQPGTVERFFRAAPDGVRAGFVNLAKATNWAAELLGLRQIE